MLHELTLLSIGIPDQTSRICCALQEYGSGRYSRKHSTFFATMMRELDLSTEPEFYFDAVPWWSLASINHNFLLTERRRHYLRYLGGLTYFEVGLWNAEKQVRGLLEHIAMHSSKCLAACS